MVLFGYNGFFEGFDIFFSGTFLLEIGCYFFLVVFFHKLFQTVNVIIFLGAVCLLYRQLVSQLVGRTGRIVFLLFITESQIFCREESCVVWIFRPRLYKAL